jgi:HEPN domain-containing protein
VTLLEKRETMVDWKRFRESIGYTQALQSKDANKWHSLALGYHAAAEILEEFRDRIPHDSRPFAFNAALSLELVLKSVLARKGVDIPNNANGHDLRLLADRAKVALAENQKLTLELFTETIIWSGRYPAPKNEMKWDDYQDRILEAHIVRSTVGNVSSTMANRDTFPNWENYSKIWAICIAEYQAER